MLKIFLSGLAVLYVGVTTSYAADGAQSRFSVEKTKYGFVRLDGQTGAMIFCREQDDQLLCLPVNGEKSSLEVDVDGLKARLAGLEARLKTAEAEGRQRLAVSSAKALTIEQQAAGALWIESLIIRFMDMTGKDR